MRQGPTHLILSATDLANFLGCRHRTALELGAAMGTRNKPRWEDPVLEALFERGLAHEAGYVAALGASGLTVNDFGELTRQAEAIAATHEAMRAGIDVIVQAALQDGQWYGRPDVLQRVEGESQFGPWSYEVADTKLARETRAGTILQLGVYCDMLAKAQGRKPEWFSVVSPEGTTRYRVDDYAAYFRLVRTHLDATLAHDESTIAATYYPEPVDHCDVCPWFRQCADRRRDDDHLSLVAGIGRDHRRELESRGVSTMADLAALPLPLPFKPERGSPSTYTRLREQARMQVEARESGRLGYELIEPIEAGTGLSRLPEPSPGDLFFDIEGDPMAEDGGREYLFGLVSLGPDGQPRYEALWAETRAQERRAFETIMARFMETWQRHPGMHVYHYAPYEPSALKRLMGRHGSYETELDRLLRAGRFVDLYAVVRQGLRVGVERYSIKNLEPCYDFTRQVELHAAGRSLRVMEQALELRRMEVVTPEVRQTVEGYNADDCVSTWRLQAWLETVRQEAEAVGHAAPRPAQADGAPSEEVSERDQRVADLRGRLMTGLPDDPEAWDADQRARHCLGYLVDWHRREDKAVWWEYFRIKELPEEELLDERLAVAGLAFVGEVGKVKRSFVHRYRFPAQELEIRRRDELKRIHGDGTFAKVIAVDRDGHTVDLHVGPSRRDERPTALFSHTHVNSQPIEDALFATGERVAEAGTIADAPVGPVRDLLLRHPPRLKSGPFTQDTDETATEFATRIVGDLDQTVLAIQGPPGSGKTYTGAQMICELVRQGKRVGITATGHKVIRNLLEAVQEAARRQHLSVAVGQKGGQPADGASAGEPSADEEDASGDEQEPSIVQTTSNDRALALLEDGDVQVLGGTAWLWSRDQFAESVDVLFVDEAGQMSLANVVGVARAAGNIVLLGDQQQLEQPQQGSHPDGVGVSALEYLLDGRRTVPAELGLFLPVTWRLAPSICAFTSEVFYEGRLRSKAGLETQCLRGGPIDGDGLWLLPVEHDGNRNASDEEVEAVAQLVDQLLAPGSLWVNEKGESQQLAPDDLRIVAPYNAHVARLADRLVGRDVPIGTVDKFQGQEAPVAIYSMATSRPEDAPRGMEFLYSLNRLNVATSRARCAAVVVASPALFEPDCSTPRQMKLANALCRYREMARPLSP